jgi:hypothetical protein
MVEGFEREKEWKFIERGKGDTVTVAIVLPFSFNMLKI